MTAAKWISLMPPPKRATTYRPPARQLPRGTQRPSSTAIDIKVDIKVRRRDAFLLLALSNDATSTWLVWKDRHPGNALTPWIAVVGYGTSTAIAYLRVDGGTATGFLIVETRFTKPRITIVPAQNGLALVGQPGDGGDGIFERERISRLMALWVPTACAPAAFQ